MLVKVKKSNFNVPFPQANDVYKVIKYVDEKLYHYHKGALRHISLDVVERQEGYYRSAAQYLGLMSGDKTTEFSEFCFRMRNDYLFSSIVLAMLQNDVFLHYFINRDIEYVTKYLKHNYGFSQETAKRRASTLKTWIKWCDIIIKENGIEVEIL
jgi:hypothetical protein